MSQSIRLDKYGDLAEKKIKKIKFDSKSFSMNLDMVLGSSSSNDHIGLNDIYGRSWEDIGFENQIGSSRGGTFLKKFHKLSFKDIYGSI